MKPVLIFLLAFIFITTACDKKSSGGGTEVSPPANLNINAVISTDNSGNVSFTATATNAVVYLFDFGDGSNHVSANGVVTHKYTASATYTVTVVAKNSTNQSISKSITVAIQKERTLVWSDEFETAGAPDAAKWGYDLGAGGWGNNELQYYTNRPENVIVSGGTLKIMAKRENFSGSEFTSARLLTKGKYSFKYGKIEVRAKLPAGIGTWPAIWMLGNNFSSVGWPASGEIDIMEHLGRELNKIHSTLHYPGHSGGNGAGGSTTITNATTAFHKYAAEWTPGYIKFSVDDVVFYTFTNSSSLPFNQEFFIILNVALGGNWPGPVDAAFNNAAMEVDYVRVYQ